MIYKIRTFTKTCCIIHKTNANKKSTLTTRIITSAASAGPGSGQQLAEKRCTTSEPYPSARHPQQMLHFDVLPNGFC